MENQKTFPVSWFLIIDGKKEVKVAVSQNLFDRRVVDGWWEIENVFLMFERSQTETGKKKAETLAGIAVQELKLKLGRRLQLSSWKVEASEFDRDFFSDKKRKIAKEQCKRLFSISFRGEQCFDSWLSACITPEEIKEVFNFVHFRSDHAFRALEKWLSLCSTFDEVKLAHDSLDREIKKDSEIFALHQDHLFDHKTVRAIVARWILVCATAKQSEEVFKAAPQFSKEQQFAMEKWLSFCKTVEEAKVALNAASTDCTRSLAIRRINELVK